MHSPSLRTEIDIKPSALKISLGQSVLTMGSCFSQSIGEKMTRYKFDVLTNPFGTTYNPISIFKALISNGINSHKFLEKRGMAFHYDFHSELRADNKQLLEKLLQRRKEEVTDHLKKADWLIVTFGTAWVYELKSSGEIVNVCHKVPQSEFNKRLLGMKEMAVAMDSMVNHFKKTNPRLNMLLTVSPVRHIRDGIQENQLSKSMLRVLCDFAVTSHDNVHYFPSYEIMVDDFRDYRFYRDDLIHPTAFAEQYIWEKFQGTYFEKETLDFIQDWKYVISAMEHRPFNPKTDEHQNFVRAQMEKIIGLSDKVDASDELAFFKAQLNK